MIQDIVDLSEGNPGAILAMSEMVKIADVVDPSNMGKQNSPILNLKWAGLKGWRIHVLFADLCGNDPALAIAVLRACQLNIISENELLCACENEGILPDRTLLKVWDLVPKVKAKVNLVGI